MITLKKRAKITGVFVMLSALLSACITPNDVALNIGAPPVVEGQTIASIRALQSRNFDTLKTEDLIQASAATLQDLGFTIGEVSKDYGLLIGSKDRDAVETGQIAVQTGLVILAAIAGSQYNPTYDQTQKINVTVVVNKIDDKSSQVRVFFDRHFTNNYGELWRADLITDAEIYQQFFEKLAASAFLEENQS